MRVSAEVRAEVGSSRVSSLAFLFNALAISISCQRRQAGHHQQAALMSIFSWIISSAARAFIAS